MLPSMKRYQLIILTSKKHLQYIFLSQNYNLNTNDKRVHLLSKPKVM